MNHTLTAPLLSITVTLSSKGAEVQPDRSVPYKSVNGIELKLSSVPNAIVLFNPVIDTTDQRYGATKFTSPTCRR